MKDFADIFGSNKNPGDWVTFTLTGSEFCILQLNHPKVSEYLYKNNIAQIDPNDIETILGIFTNSVLMDWKNVVIDGETLEYNEENAKKLLTNYPPLLQFLTEESTNLATNKLAKLEKTKKK